MTLKVVIAELFGQITKVSEPRLTTEYGVVTDVETNDAGTTLSAAVRTDQGVLLPGVSIGVTGVARGARVELAGRGRIGSARYTVVDTRIPGTGQAGQSPSHIINTPLIHSIESTVGIGTDGAAVLTLKVLTWQIEEQWRYGQQVQYLWQVRRLSDLQPIGDGVVNVPQRQVAGALAAELDGGEEDEFTIIEAPITPPPSLNFTIERGLVEVGGEIIFCRAFDPDTLTFSNLTRAQDTPESVPTSAETHEEGMPVKARSVLGVIGGLATGVQYEVRVFAGTGQNRWSNPSAWEIVTGGSDATVPGWASGSGLAVAAVAEAWRVSWSRATTDPAIVGAYQVRVSPDDSTWTTYEPGDVLAWVLPGVAGEYRYFQVRAVSRSRVTGSWSSSVRAFMPSARKVSTPNSLTNYELTSNVTDWDLIGTGLSLSHESGYGGNALGCAKVSGGRSALSQVDLYQDFIVADDTVENTFLARCYLAASANFDEATDLVTLIVLAGSFEYGIPIAGADIQTVGGGQWTMLEVEGKVPEGVSTLTFVVRIYAADTPTETISVYVDDVGLYLLSEKREV